MQRSFDRRPHVPGERYFGSQEKSNWWVLRPLLHLLLLDCSPPPSCSGFQICVRKGHLEYGGREEPTSHLSISTAMLGLCHSGIMVPCFLHCILGSSVEEYASGRTAPFFFPIIGLLQWLSDNWINRNHLQEPGRLGYIIFLFI